VLDRQQITYAVQIHGRAYALLQELRRGLDLGLVPPRDATDCGTLQERALGWIRANYESLPDSVRPPVEDVVPLANMFSTYLLNSFEIDTGPGQRRYSELPYDPYDSWHVQVSQLRPQKVDAAGREAAKRLKVAVLEDLAKEATVAVGAETMRMLLRERSLREAIGLVAYGTDLLTRIDGHARGTASLALWRSFAWTSDGSPKKDFTLSAEAILDAESVILCRLEEGEERG
jgi:hypothetical protein